MSFNQNIKKSFVVPITLWRSLSNVFLIPVVDKISLMTQSNNIYDNK